MAIPTSFRLSQEAKDLLALLAQQRGTSQAAVLELLIREAAEHKARDLLSRQTLATGKSQAEILAKLLENA